MGTNTKVNTTTPTTVVLHFTFINVQELTVEALISQDRQSVYHAAMMDPHTGAELDLEQIWLMVDDLLEAHKDWLPEFLSKT